MTIIGAVRDSVLRVNTRGNLEKFLTLWVRCEGQMDKLLIMINAMSHPSDVRSQRAAADQGNDPSFYREEFASPLLSSSYEPLLDVNTIRVFVKITQVTMMGSPHPFQIWPVSSSGHFVIT